MNNVHARHPEHPPIATSLRSRRLRCWQKGTEQVRRKLISASGKAAELRNEQLESDNAADTSQHTKGGMAGHNTLIEEADIVKDFVAAERHLTTYS